MSEENIEVELEEELEVELDAGSGLTEPVDPPIEPTPIPESDIEREAREAGHISLDEWVAQGKDPKLWDSPHAYVKYGKLLESSRRERQEFETRLINANKIHEFNMNLLISKQREAAAIADVDAFDAYTKEIKELEKLAPNAAVINQSPPEVTLWEAKNKWIFEENNPKALEAKALFKAHKLMFPNAPVQEALDYIDKKITKPEPNPRRETATMTEKGQRLTQSTKKTLGWNDLTNEEKSIFNKIGDELYSGDKKLFLKAVADTRKQK